MDSFRQGVYDLLLPKRKQAVFEEFRFFTEVFKPLDKKYHDIVENNKGKER